MDALRLFADNQPVPVDVKREHTTPTMTSSQETKDAINALHALITQITAAQATSMKKTLNVGGKRFGNRQSAVKSLISRTGNKEEKQKFVDFCKKWKDADEARAASLLVTIYQFAKVVKLDVAGNLPLLQNAQRKASEQGAAALIFAVKISDYITQYPITIEPLLKAALADGCDPQYFTFGNMMECFREDIADVFRQGIKSWESSSFLYSKIAFYGVPMEAAIQCCYKFCAAVYHMCALAIKLGFDKTAFEKPNLKNQDINEACRKVATFVDKTKYNKEEGIKFLKANFTSGVALNEGACLIISLGVPPYAFLQSYQFKMGSSNAMAMADAALNVGKIFKFVANCSNALTGRNVVLHAKKLGDLKKEVWDLWKPMYVVARCLRAAIDPSVGGGNVNTLDISDASLNEDPLFAIEDLVPAI